MHAISNTQIADALHFNNVKQLLEESSLARLYFNGIFYATYRKELLIIIEANFSHITLTLSYCVP